MNILCLHGCHQTLESFKNVSVMQELIRFGNKEKINFHFIEGKYDHPNGGGKTWYHIPLVLSDIGKIKYDPTLVNDVLDDLDKIIEELNINVLLGFSQGGNVVDTYLRYRGNKKIKCAVIFSGYSLADSDNNYISDVPLLNIWSKSDDIVPYNLAPSSYKNITTIEHDKGHKLPTSKPMLRNIIGYIKDKFN